MGTASGPSSGIRCIAKELSFGCSVIRHAGDVPSIGIGSASDSYVKVHELCRNYNDLVSHAFFTTAYHFRTQWVRLDSKCMGYPEAGQFRNLLQQVPAAIS
jgi:hypothetical protein